MPETSEPGLPEDVTRGRKRGLPTPAFLPGGQGCCPSLGSERPRFWRGARADSRQHGLGSAVVLGCGCLHTAGPDLLSVGRADLGGWPATPGPSWSSLWALCELPAVCPVPAALAKCQQP